MSGAKIITTALLLLAFSLAGLSVQAVTVGPLDGKSGPSLPALGAPAGIHAEDLVDFSFPRELEERGDLRAAVLEWQRVARKAFGTDHDMALGNAVRLYIRLQEPAVAGRILDQMLTENPSSSHLQEALYHVATGADVLTAAKAVGQLQSLFPQSVWTQAALLGSVWQQAETSGRVTETYKLAQAEELKKRIGAIRTAQQRKEAIAAAAGVVAPGVGHMLAGHVAQGIAVLLIWCLFTLAFLSACRHRHYAYAFLFVLPAVSLWLTGPLVAAKLVQDQTRQQIQKGLLEWTDLRPAVPQAGPPAATPELLPALPQPQPAATTSPTVPSSPTLSTPAQM